LRHIRQLNEINIQIAEIRQHLAEIEGAIYKIREKVR